MKILLCAILSLPLILLGVENIKGTTNVDSTKAQSIESIDTSMSKSIAEQSSTEQILKNMEVKKEQSNSESDKEKAIESLIKPLKTKEPSGFILGIGATFDYAFDLNASWYGSSFSTYNRDWTGAESNPFAGGGDTIPYRSGNYEWGIDYSRFNVGGEILFGYKWFFGRKGIFGMRLYADYNFRISHFTNQHNGSLNYDIMFNFNTHRAFKFGMLFGIHTGAGVLNYKEGTSCDYYHNDITMETYYFPCSSEKLQKIDVFSLGTNVGFRFVIYDHSAIELIAQPRYIVPYEMTIMGITRFIYTF